MSRLIRLMFSRRWLLATVIVIVVVGVFIMLGFWQLDRLEQRRVQNAQLTAVLEGDVLRLPNDLTPQEGEQVMANQAVTVAGTYDFDHQKRLILQTWGGRNGVNLITPLVLADGETAVLIDRGWIPDAEAEQNLANYNNPQTAQIEGYIALSQSPPRSATTTSLPEDNQLYRVDIPALQQQLPYELYPFYIIQSPPPDDLATFPYHREREIDLSEGPHLSYAIQWFLFAGVLIIMFPIFITRRSQQKKTK